MSPLGVQRITKAYSGVLRLAKTTAPAVLSTFEE